MGSGVRRPARHAEILDPPRRNVIHPAVDGDVLARGPRLPDGFGGTNVFDLALDVFLDDQVEGGVEGGGGEVEGGDEGREGGEPARERRRLLPVGGGGRHGLITRRCASALRVSGEHDYAGG